MSEDSLYKVDLASILHNLEATTVARRKLSLQPEVDDPKLDPIVLRGYLNFVFYHILVTGHAPTFTGTFANEPVHEFITRHAQMNYSKKNVLFYISRILGGIPVDKVDPAWVKTMVMRQYDEETRLRYPIGPTLQNKLPFGMAGYRLPNIFCRVKPDAIGHEPYLAAYRVAQSFRQAGLCWDFHPATRSAAVISTYGDPSKNMANLLLDVYTSDTILSMITAGLLPVYPFYDPKYQKYKTWKKLYVATCPVFKYFQPFAWSDDYCA